MSTINKNLYKITDIYDLSKFNNNIYNLKFVFSKESIINSKKHKKSFMKFIYVDDILIDKKYDKNWYGRGYNIKGLLQNIKHITNLYKLLNDSEKKFDIYILTNTQHSFKLNTKFTTLNILNKSYFSNQDLGDLEFDLGRYFYNMKSIDDNNIFVNLYIRENININKITNYTYSDYINEGIIDNIFLKYCDIMTLDKNNRHKYGIGILVECHHNIRTFNTNNTKIKSYTLPISNMKNIYITLDLYCFDKNKIHYYFNKLINHNTNEIISLLPENKCNICDNITNVKTHATYNKENLCQHIINRIINNLYDSYKEYVKKNKLSFEINCYDINNIIDNIELINDDNNYTYSLMNKIINNKKLEK